MRFFQLDKKDFWGVNYSTISFDYTKNIQTDIISTRKIWKKYLCPNGQKKSHWMLARRAACSQLGTYMQKNYAILYMQSKVYILKKNYNSVFFTH